MQESHIVEGFPRKSDDISKNGSYAYLSIVDIFMGRKQDFTQRGTNPVIKNTEWKIFVPPPMYLEGFYLWCVHSSLLNRSGWGGQFSGGGGIPRLKRLRWGQIPLFSTCILSFIYYTLLFKYAYSKLYLCIYIVSEHAIFYVSWNMHAQLLAHDNINSVDNVIVQCLDSAKDICICT